ncbi:MAG: hypothetical protein Q9M94_03385 [Candidatus Gracilibacteria bacterium]|nr:hypothetical protein [Candidatus Gracilibacteria bacterium]MDQ7022959.1 hypothetical protein [Candidatus Gracilibacteria bacterium]
MTNFYNLNLGENIPEMEKELYFKQNKEVLGLLEFTNSYIKLVGKSNIKCTRP